MADEMMNDGEFTNDQTLEISGDDDSSGISGLKQKISDLEKENNKITGENKENERRIEELTASIKKLSDENSEMKSQVEKAQYETRMLGQVTARAADLEADTSRLQHDLASALSDLQETSAEVAELKKVLEAMKAKVNEKDVELEAAKTGSKSLQELKIELEASVEKMRDEIGVLKRSLEEKEKIINEFETKEGVISDGYKHLEKLKIELEASVENMRNEIGVLKRSLEEKEKVINGFETKERAISDGGNANATNGDGGEKKPIIDALKKKDLVVGGGILASVVALGAACYARSAKNL